MAVTPFRHIDFAVHEPVTKEKLDQYQSNVQWLVDNTPVTLNVDTAGRAGIDSLIIVGGRVRIPFVNGYGAGRVYFNGAFASSTYPVVTSGVVSEGYKHLWVNVGGIGEALLADSTGFDIAVQTTEASNPTYPSVVVN